MFRHTASSQANGISFGVSHSCVDIIVRFYTINIDIAPSLSRSLLTPQFLVRLRGHGLRELLHCQHLGAGRELDRRRQLRHVRGQVLLHLPEAELRRVRQRVLLAVSALRPGRARQVGS